MVGIVLTVLIFLAYKYPTFGEVLIIILDILSDIMEALAEVDWPDFGD
jgi:hypothetical protein